MGGSKNATRKDRQGLYLLRMFAMFAMLIKKIALPMLSPSSTALADPKTKVSFASGSKLAGKRTFMKRLEGSDMRFRA